MSDAKESIYWTVNGTKHYRQGDALLAAAASNSNIKFYYHHDTFKEFNWEVEPPQSFDDLCLIRAQQLRDNYKYLRLWYSGGADSHTVLRTFMDNNIHIDEIVMIRVGVIDRFDTLANVEINQRSTPYLQSIQPSIPKTKISIIDLAAHHYVDYYKSDWFLQAPIWVFAEDTGIVISNQESILRAGLTIPDGCAEITGGDKPKIIRHDDVYYVPIVDSMFPYLHITNLEEFYITPNLPELHSKQSHVMKHILEKTFPKDQNITHHIYDPKNIDRTFKELWYNCCRTVINPELDVGKGWELITPKSHIRIVEARGRSEETLKHYLGSLNEFQQSVGSQWEETNKPPTGNISGIYSLGKYKHE